MAENEQSARKFGLGRGLGALMPGSQAIPARPMASGRAPIDSIHANPEQPRRRFEEAALEALADSIRQHGVLQPLLVVPEESGYRLIAGERRLRAARMAGLTEVPVTLHEEPGSNRSLALSLIENIQRHDLNAIEEAEAYRRLIDEFQMTQEDMARQVGRTRAHISNTMRLLGLAEAVQAALQSDSISAGHARALASLPADAQELGLRRVLRDELSVRQTEVLARSLAAEGTVKARKRTNSEQDPQTRELESRFRDALQARVSLQRKRKGGRLVVEFYSDEELDGLYRRIVGTDAP
ncbi:MAG TPA: ParB/RepB/Spo0J family partition protein [Candidatus Solibacter sp.]|jgi:ParB family chromosome partitioning protein|nr:ParB/RepB/Spo0J family partition protein [Candidatus Solibacter sp.]